MRSHTGSSVCCRKKKRGTPHTLPDHSACLGRNIKATTQQASGGSPPQATSSTTATATSAQERSEEGMQQAKKREEAVGSKHEVVRRRIALPNGSPQDLPRRVPAALAQLCKPICFSCSRTLMDVSSTVKLVQAYFKQHLVSAQIRSPCSHHFDKCQFSEAGKRGRTHGSRSFASRVNKRANPEFFVGAGCRGWCGHSHANQGVARIVSECGLTHTAQSVVSNRTVPRVFWSVLEEGEQCGYSHTARCGCRSFRCWPEFHSAESDTPGFSIFAYSRPVRISTCFSAQQQKLQP